MYIKSDLIKLSGEIAYKGKIGRLREDFCIKSIKHKKEVIKQIDNIQKNEARIEGKSITCRKGCNYSSCCMEYIDATLQECEAIVYYLYRNAGLLRSFLKNYRRWRKRVDETEDLLGTLEKLSFDFIWLQDEQGMAQAGELYYHQKITCPFLCNNLCSIYEIRPYGCASYCVTTPVSQCHPDYLGYVPVKRHLPHMEIARTDFYYGALERPILVCMQKAVYEILEKGYFYLSTIPGLHGIEKEAISDKKVRIKYKSISSNISE